MLNIKGDGNLILLAPHTLYLKRESEIHIPELFIKKIVNKIRVKFDNKLIKTITWKEKPIKKKILELNNDPNYLAINNYKKNIWSKEIKNLKKKKNIFVIDFHGMKDKHGYDIIFGLEALKKLKKYKYKKFEKYLKKIFNLFSSKFRIKIGYNILFKGYINNKILTLSYNCILNHIPAIQVELSLNFRRLLINNNPIFNDFVDCLLKISDNSPTFI